MYTFAAVMALLSAASAQLDEININNDNNSLRAHSLKATSSYVEPNDNKPIGNFGDDDGNSVPMDEDSCRSELWSFKACDEANGNPCRSCDGYQENYILPEIFNLHNITCTELQTDLTGGCCGPCTDDGISYMNCEFRRKGCVENAPDPVWACRQEVERFEICNFDNNFPCQACIDNPDDATYGSNNPDDATNGFNLELAEIIYNFNLEDVTCEEVDLTGGCCGPCSDVGRALLNCVSEEIACSGASGLVELSSSGLVIALTVVALFYVWI